MALLWLTLYLVIGAKEGRPRLLVNQDRDLSAGPRMEYNVRGASTLITVTGGYPIRYIFGRLLRGITKRGGGVHAETPNFTPPNPYVSTHGPFRSDWYATEENHDFARPSTMLHRRCQARRKARGRMKNIGESM